MLKKIKLEEAVGMVIGHDVTRVIPGEFEGPAFRRGHIIAKEDIPMLLSMGKERIYVIDEEDGEVHEEEAAKRIAAAVATEDMDTTKPRQGRVNIKAEVKGILRINRPLLNEVNSIPGIILSTLHEYSICRQGDMIAGAKIIPLYIAEARLEELEELCRNKGKVVWVAPFKQKKVGVVITGSEVYKGIIKDKFGEYIKDKVEALGSVIHHQTIVPDDEDLIAKAVLDMKYKGCDIIVVCSGLSVDPDDVTAEGIERSGAEIISYGAPVMPGAMFLFATLSDIPIIGAPAAVISKDTTLLDIMLPRLLADVPISREDIIAFGHGGLCLDCAVCNYPICFFCK